MRERMRRQHLVRRRTGTYEESVALPLRRLVDLGKQARVRVRGQRDDGVPQRHLDGVEVAAAPFVTVAVRCRKSRRPIGGRPISSNQAPEVLRDGVRVQPGTVLTRLTRSFVCPANHSLGGQDFFSEIIWNRSPNFDHGLYLPLTKIAPVGMN